jgi:hypothetical protein
MTSRYLLCRPLDGLNDTLGQVEICRAYAARHGRILIVDGRLSGVLGEFGDYFQMEGDGHIFNMTDSAMPQLDTPSCYPAEVQGRVTTVRGKKNPIAGGARTVDFETGVPLSFPFDHDHPETLLLHQQAGGCGKGKSFDLINRLTLVPSLARQARDKIAGLPASYSAIHIRNTDLRTDLGMVLDAIRDHVRDQDLLLCSDDPAVLGVMQAGLPATRIHQITTPHFENNQPQHKAARTADGSIRHLIAAASLFDLCALAFADTLYVPVVLSQMSGGGLVETKKNRLSGFSKLAAHLCEDKDRPRRLLSAAGVGLKPQSKTGRVRLIKPI